MVLIWTYLLACVLDLFGLKQLWWFLCGCAPSFLLKTSNLHKNTRIPRPKDMLLQCRETGFLQAATLEELKREIERQVEDGCFRGLEANSSADLAALPFFVLLACLPACLPAYLLVCLLALLLTCLFAYLLVCLFVCLLLVLLFQMPLLDNFWSKSVKTLTDCTGERKTWLTSKQRKRRGEVFGSRYSIAGNSRYPCPWQFPL